ncbi:uncharacterized protein LOC117794012 isoform X1 [Drosophila innubila]|uniref:uncharacterized protein LOC117794012 isoform X1 n=1 Tax=Drosophila innubila TaxID=198719 RepID=UPI00148C6998|nr:uncharacterized protein LOC117794012 isoform X1 [Drosophila innubila]
MPERSISQRDVDEIEIESDEEDDELEQGVGLPVQPVRKRGGANSPEDNARRHGRGSSGNVNTTNGPTHRQRSRERERFGSGNAVQEAKFYDDDERRNSDDDDDNGSGDEDDIEMLDYDTLCIVWHRHSCG